MSDEISMKKMDAPGLKFSGGVWRTNPVEQQPEIRLARWRIFEVPANEHYPETTRHFVGWGGSGRVSSAIVEFDPVTLRGKTRSGRVYELAPGGCGINMDAMYVLGVWLEMQGLPSDDVRYITLECPNDTNGDGDCGRKHCPYCGE